MKSNFLYSLEVIGCRIYQAVFKICDYVALIVCRNISTVPEAFCACRIFFGKKGPITC